MKKKKYIKRKVKKNKKVMKVLKKDKKKQVDKLKQFDLKLEVHERETELDKAV